MSDNRKIAFYCRAATPDDGAIETQRRLLTAHASEHGSDDTVLYADNGASGLSRERPALSRLLADIEDGRIGTVLVTDFSRLARSMIDTAHFLENVFPKYGVRFVAVKSGYDSDDREDCSISVVPAVIGKRYPPIARRQQQHPVPVNRDCYISRPICGVYFGIYVR